MNFSLMICCIELDLGGRHLGFGEVMHVVRLYIEMSSWSHR